MNNEILETAPSETDYIEYDYTETPPGDGASDQINIYSPASINIFGADVGESIDDTVPESKEETESEVFLEDLEVADPVRVLSVSANNEQLRAALSPGDFKNLWTLSINGNEYRVLFPVGAELSVVNGKLVNLSSSNITGVIMDSSLSDSSYFNYTFTVLPFTSSNTQTTVYRYGARSYLTRYYPNTANNLATDVSYYNASVVDRPVGAAFNRYQITIIIMLAAALVVSIIGGLIRR